MNSLFAFGGSIFLILFLSVLIRYFIERSASYRTMLFLFFPGIVLHEIFHAIASVIVGAKIHGMRLFSARGGEVLHERPRLPFGQIFTPISKVLLWDVTPALLFFFVLSLIFFTAKKAAR